jgi:F-type H+-transporting ATPase subunit delta
MVIPQLSYKYARAFLADYGHELTYATMHDFSRLQEALIAQRETLMLITYGAVDRQQAYDAVMRIVKAYIDSPAFGKLVKLLIEHKRIGLLASVVAAIQELYKTAHGVTTCSIESAHPLTQEQRTVLERLISQRLKEGDHPSVGDYNYTIDKRLIAGIRIRVDFLLWDGSLVGQLQKLYQKATATLGVCSGSEK